MKVWVAVIFVYNTEDEYGYITNHFLDSKPFDRKEKALNYIRDFRRLLRSNNFSRYWNGKEIDVYSGRGFVLEDNCRIYETEI